MAEDDEWWNDGGSGMVGLVGYSQRAMSGARWEAFSVCVMDRHSKPGRCMPGPAIPPVSQLGLGGRREIKHGRVLG